ncbi:hypothetical protein ACVSQB_34215, partial [Bradyrhizobium elkanii]
MKFDLVPSLLCGTKMTLSVRFATLAQIFFEIVNSDQRMFTESVVHNVHAGSRVRLLSQREVVQSIRIGRAAVSELAQTKTPASLPGFCISLSLSEIPALRCT